MLIMALYPNHIAYCPLLLSETLFTSLLLLALVSHRLKGAFFAMCCFVKAQVLFIPFFFLMNKKKSAAAPLPQRSKFTQLMPCLYSLLQLSVR